MKRIYCILAVLCFVLSVKGLGQVKKYDLKSGIVTFDLEIRMGTLTIPKKVVIYFDDFGMKECKEEYEGKNLKESFFSDGKDLYKVIHAEKTAYKSGKAFRGTEMKFDWNEVREKDKESGKAKKLPNVVVAGKECESYVYEDRGSKTTFAGWKGLCLLTDLISGAMRSTAKAAKIEENQNVGPEKFKVPEGYAVK